MSRLPEGFTHAVERDDEVEFRVVVSSPAKTASRRYAVTVSKRRHFPPGEPPPLAEISFPGLASQPAPVIEQFGTSLLFAAALAREQDGSVPPDHPLHAAVFDYADLTTRLLADLSAEVGDGQGLLEIERPFWIIHRAMESAAARRLEQVRTALQDRLDALRLEARSEDPSTARAANYAVLVLETLIGQLF